MSTLGLSFHLHPGGPLTITASTTEGEIVLNVDLPLDDAIHNLQVLADLLGYQVTPR